MKKDEKSVEWEMQGTESPYAIIFKSRVAVISYRTFKDGTEYHARVRIQLNELPSFEDTPPMQKPFAHKSGVHASATVPISKFAAAIHQAMDWTLETYLMKFEAKKETK